MKNKKAFTLVEIIVCIVLIVLVGTSTTIAFKLNNSKNNKENINNSIKTALDVYLNLYKDSDGDKYIDGINNGGKGLYISLNTLVSEGLLEKDIINTLENEYKDETNFKIFISNSIKTNDDELCGNNLIEYTFSWETDTTTPMYLCPKTTTSTGSDGSNESSDETGNNSGDNGNDDGNADGSTSSNNVLGTNIYLAQGSNPNNWLQFDELAKKLTIYDDRKINFRILSIKDNKLTAIVGDYDSVENITNYYSDGRCKSTFASRNNNLSLSDRQNMMGFCLKFIFDSKCFETFKDIEIYDYSAKELQNSMSNNSYRTLKEGANWSLRIIKYNEFMQTFEGSSSWLPKDFFYGNTTIDIGGCTGKNNIYYDLVYKGDGDNYIYPVFELKLSDNVKLVKGDCDEQAGTETCPYKIEIKDNYCGLE